MDEEVVYVSIYTNSWVIRKLSEFTKCYSRDCRTESTKEWYGLIDKERNQLTLYKKMKRKVKLGEQKYTYMAYDRFVPLDIFKTGIFRLGTSTYEIAKDDLIEKKGEDTPISSKDMVQRQKLISKLKSIVSDLENGYDGFLYLYEELVENKGEKEKKNELD